MNVPFATVRPWTDRLGPNAEWAQLSNRSVNSRGVHSSLATRCIGVFLQRKTLFRRVDYLVPARIGKREGGRLRSEFFQSAGCILRGTSGVVYTPTCSTSRQAMNVC